MKPISESAASQEPVPAPSFEPPAPVPAADTTQAAQPVPAVSAAAARDEGPVAAVVTAATFEAPMALSGAQCGLMHHVL